MTHEPVSFARRDLFRRLASGATGLALAHWTIPGAFAEDLVRTPSMTEGPFYPDRLPLDRDNDLVIVNDSITPAVGEVTHLSGKILDGRGQPLRDATIEIWQVDNFASYLHTDGRGDKRDGNFQGYGKFLTGTSGDYRFRTIKPVPYPGRTPHIHVKVSVKDRELLTTQLFVKGHPQNRRDMLLDEIRDAKARESVQVDFSPIPDSKTKELRARFDIVLGWTPPDAPAAPAKKRYL